MISKTHKQKRNTTEEDNTHRGINSVYSTPVALSTNSKMNKSNLGLVQAQRGRDITQQTSRATDATNMVISVTTLLSRTEGQKEMQHNFSFRQDPQMMALQHLT